MYVLNTRRDMEDMRVKFIENNINEAFKIKSVGNGKIVFTGGDIDLVCGMPRKIEASKDGMRVHVTKDSYTMRNINEKINSSDDNKQHAVHADSVCGDSDTTPVRDEQDDGSSMDEHEGISSGLREKSICETVS